MSEPQGRDSKQTAPLQLNWRRNLYVIWIAEFIGIVGFTLAMPFLPYYVQALGVTAPGQVELWSGLLHSMHAVTMGIMAPVWGSLADRLGHKLMVVRAMLGGALLLSSMAFVTNVQQLLFLRTVQGAVTGTVVACMTLVAAGTPRHQRPAALGTLQMGVYLGAALGPSIGGFLADTWGYRTALASSGLFLGVAGILVVASVHEGSQALVAKEDRSFVKGLRAVVRSPGVLTVFGTLFLAGSALRAVNPMVPLFVQALAPTRERIASLTGLISSATMLTTAVGTVVATRYADRIGVRRVLLTCLAGCALCYIAAATVHSVTHLMFLRALAGLSYGGLVSTLSVALAAMAPEGRQGALFGLYGSVHSAASVVGPILGGALASAWGLRVPFVTAGLGFGAAMGLLLRGRQYRE